MFFKYPRSLSMMDLSQISPKDIDKPLHVLDTIYDLTKEGRHNISNSDITKYTKIQDIQGEELYYILKVLLDKGFISEIFSIKGLIGMSGYTAVSITNKGLIHIENLLKTREELDEL